MRNYLQNLSLRILSSKFWRIAQLPDEDSQLTQVLNICAELQSKEEKSNKGHIIALVTLVILIFGAYSSIVSEYAVIKERVSTVRNDHEEAQRNAEKKQAHDHHQDLLLERHSGTLERHSRFMQSSTLADD